MEKNFTEQDSLRVINEMIAQARDNIQKGSADSMILSGYCVAATAILNIILLHVLPNPNMAFWIWLLMVPMIAADKLLDAKRDKSAIVKTHIDKIIGNTWRAFACSVVVLFIVIFGLVNIYNTWLFTILFTPIILTMMGLAQYVMAVASRFRPFYWGVIAFWLGAALCVITMMFFRNPDIQFIILAISTIIGFVIPGHILNRKAKEHV